MTTSTDTETDPGSKGKSAEWIDKTVSDTFDEFLMVISKKIIHHKSENLNRDSPSKDGGIYDKINSYHAFCKLCEQHFYCCSVPSDINSFFQKHLNTSYHRQMRWVDLPPDTTPMFTWEEKFLTGRCNVCQISGLNSYVLETEFKPLELMKSHVCVLNTGSGEPNEKLLEKFNSLKKYCGLKIFEKKFIKTVEGSVVCLLCGLKLPWSEEKATCHLHSDEHFQKFCLLLRKRFNFGPKDVLNGFNLEAVTRALIPWEPPPMETFSEFNDQLKCMEISNDGENPYLEGSKNFSFSPKHLPKLPPNKHEDFMHNNSCLLCNVVAKPEHFDSNMHLKNAVNLNKSSFDKPEKYNIYCRNVVKRQRIMNTLKRLKLVPEKATPQVPTPVKEKQTEPLRHENYFEKLLEKKLTAVKYLFTTKGSNVFCEVCEMLVPFDFEIPHLNSSFHMSEERKWEKLIVSFENKKFTETFKKIRNLILCLLCGAVLQPSSFCAHVKTKTHNLNFEYYCKLGLSSSISSSVVLQKDFSCYCSACDLLLSSRKQVSSLKLTAENIVQHWPCEKLRKKTTPGKPEVTKNKQIFAEDLEGQKVENVVENIVNAVEKKKLKKVTEKTVIAGLENLELNPARTSMKKKPSKVLVKIERPPPVCDHFSSCSCNNKPAAVGQKQKDKQKPNELNKRQLGIGKSQKRKNWDKEEDHEILIIKGLFKRQRKFDFLFPLFSVFGKMRYIRFDGKTTILAFEDSGVAEKAAKGSSQFIGNYKITLTVSTKKNYSRNVVEETPPSLNEDLVALLEDPLKLTDFLSNLTMQAIVTMNSPVELKRELLVSNTIINVIRDSFPQSRCYPFGSRVSGLTLNNSDFDVFLDCGGMYNGLNMTPSEEQKLVRTVAKKLRRTPEIDVTVIVTQARVPIVSFLHKPTLMHCDLSFKNGLSVQNTLLIKFLASLDCRVRPLILFFKHWAKLNRLHGPPNFSSYAIAMLVIFYLQQLELPILPTIESLQNNSVGPRTIIAGWDCTVNTNSSVFNTENKDSLPQLLMGLFDFYASFDYKNNVISPLTGRLLPRNAFFSPKNADLPMCYKRNILNIPPPIENLVNRKINICIVDPFDISHVLTKSFTLCSLKNFTFLCRESEKCLRKGVMSSKP